jgi:hypothetical protein
MKRCSIEKPEADAQRRPLVADGGPAPRVYGMSQPFFLSIPTNSGCALAFKFFLNSAKSRSVA